MTDPPPDSPPSDSQPRVESTLFYAAGRLLTKGILAAMHRPAIEGLHHLPRSGGVVIASNHQSFLDIPLIASATRRHVAFVARSTLRESRLLKFIMSQSGVILVHRARADHSALRSMVDYLRRGGCVALFPEGTRTRTGSLGRLRSGAVIAARKAGVPIVPAGVRGCFAVFPPGRKIPRLGRIGLRFGETLDPSAPGALELLRARIATLCGDDAAPPGRFESVPRS